MRLLLFVISFLFTFIFYIFHLLSKWLDIYWNKISEPIALESLSGNLLIESFLFLLINFFILFYFLPLNKRKWNKVSKIWFFYLLFYIILFFIIYFIESFLNTYVSIFLIIFLFSDIIFNFISNFTFLEKQKIDLRIFWLILNYINILLWFFILIKQDFFILVFYIIIYNIIFNLYIHKQFTNYVSLTFSISSVLIIFYVLFLQLEEFLVLFF